MKKILFINPGYGANITKKSRVLGLPPYALLILASITPKDRFTVEILDEGYESIDFDSDADLVAITCLTYTAPRAYWIGDQFKKRGVSVVMGGIHPTILPDEAGQHADSIVIGEGDDIWIRLLNDFEKCSLKPVYQMESFPDISRLQPLDRSLLKARYAINTIQTTRGCPYNCNYCAVTRLNGGRYRFRDLDLVAKEIRQMKGRKFFITDDNIIGKGKIAERRALELFERLQSEKVEWAAQSTINIADNPELMKAARQGGARAMLVGLESIDPEVLRGFRKTVNLKQGQNDYMASSIRKMHDHGLAVVGSFIFSPRYSTPASIDRTVEFAIRHHIDAIQIFILTPFPGSEIFEQYRDRGDLVLTHFPEDWEAYNGFAVVYKTSTMSDEQMYRKMFESYKRFSGLGTSIRRGFHTFRYTRSTLSTGLALFWNQGIYATLKSVPQLKAYSV